MNFSFSRSKRVEGRLDVVFLVVNLEESVDLRSLVDCLILSFKSNFLKIYVFAPAAILEKESLVIVGEYSEQTMKL